MVLCSLCQPVEETSYCPLQTEPLIRISELSEFLMPAAIYAQLPLLWLNSDDPRRGLFTQQAWLLLPYLVQCIDLLPFVVIDIEFARFSYPGFDFIRRRSWIELTLIWADFLSGKLWDSFKFIQYLWTMHNYSYQGVVGLAESLPLSHACLSCQIN